MIPRRTELRLYEEQQQQKNKKKHAILFLTLTNCQPRKPTSICISSTTI